MKILVVAMLLAVSSCCSVQRTGVEPVLSDAKKAVKTLPESKDKKVIAAALDACTKQNDNFAKLEKKYLAEKSLADKWRGLRDSSIVILVLAVIAGIGFYLYKFGMPFRVRV